MRQTNRSLDFTAETPLSHRHLPPTGNSGKKPEEAGEEAAAARRREETKETQF